MAHRTPAEVFPPGEFIGDELEARGWSQAELADILGRPARLVSELVAGKRGITPETARGLGAAFGTGPEFWMNLERDYQLARATHDDETVQRRAHLYSKAPVKEMIKRGWILPSDNIDVLEKRIKDFLQVPNLDEEPTLAHAARKRDYTSVSPAQWAWLFRVQQIASHIAVAPYSEAALRANLPKLEQLLAAPEEARHVPRILSESGVRFVIVERLPQGNIDGVCCWVDGESPVIGMSLRRDKIDNFWFVLRHEIEHVLRGDGKDEWIIDTELEGERAGTGTELPEEERVANAVAANFCAPTDKLASFLTRKHPFYYERDVVAFARLLNRHPGLIVGQMQFRLKNYSYLTKYLVKVRSIVLPGAIADGWGQIPSLPQQA
jgi:HTH-type transcriptional regulator/antitoxin HigA